MRGGRDDRIAFTHDQARSAEVSLVIDVLRGATTVVQALAGGYERVLCADSSIVRVRRRRATRPRRPRA
jgi:phosphosulfolactate phosphohydrolase-like enzyme